MRPLNPPEPRYAFAWRRHPRSGNAINGLGVAERIRARPVFHSGSDAPLEWQALDDFFGLISPGAIVWQIIRNRWQLRHATGPVARKRRREVDDPDAMADEIKARARALGAGIVGIAEITPDDLYDGCTVPYRHAICIGLPMDRKKMVRVPQKPAAVEVMRAYVRAGRVAVRLARSIRRMGWPARAYANPNSVDILQIPLAIRAGLGQLGKHGSLISREYGSNFRLAMVVTDLPLAIDRPVDLGVDDLCVACRRCTLDCPPGAIMDARQMVRGVTKWYVDFDKCIPYFVITAGCGICIEVCPWSEPGRGPELSRRLLAKRAETTHTKASAA